MLQDNGSGALLANGMEPYIGSAVTPEPRPPYAKPSQGDRLRLDVSSPSGPLCQAEPQAWRRFTEGTVVDSFSRDGVLHWR